MEPITAFLLSMQAAGAITSIWSANSAQKTIQQGRQLEKAAIDMNLEAANYEYQEASLASMQELRQNLANQAVMQAARGNRAGTEGTVGAVQKSISSQGADQQARRMNLLAREAELRAADVMSGMHTLKSETELGRKLATDIISGPATYGLREFGKTDLAHKWGFSKASS